MTRMQIFQTISQNLVIIIIIIIIEKFVLARKYLYEYDNMHEKTIWNASRICVLLRSI